MGYQFQGFFAEHAENLLTATIRQWPQARVKRLHKPFSGVALRLPDPNTFETDPEADAQIEANLTFQDELPAWTTNFPQTTFVYLEADCFGGHCLYQGYVCRNGNTLATESGDKALTRLLSHLGVKLNSQEFFEPLERDFPW